MPIPIISNLVPANSGYFSLLDPIYIQGVNYPVSTTGVRDNIPSGLRKEGMLVYVTANSTPYRLINQSWVAEPRATGLGDLNNVSIVGASSGQFLGFNGSIWTAAFASGIGGSTTFIGLTDVDVTGAISGDYLRYNGTKWVNTSGVLFSRLGPGTITGVKTYVVGSGATLQYGTDGVVNANKFQNYSTIPIALGGTSLNAVSDGAILYGTSTTTLEFNALDFKWDWNNHGLCLGANNISSQSASGTLHIGAYNTGVPPLYIQPRVLTAVPRDNVFEYNGSGFYFTNFYGTRLLLATTSMDINDIAVGTLGIAKGGTNNTSYNTSGILYYNGSAFTTIAPPTNASSGGLVQSFAAGPSLLYGGASGQLAGWDGRKWVASNSTSGTDNSISVILQPITTARNAIYPIGNVRGLAIRPLSTNTTSPFIIQNSGIVGNVLFEVSSTGDLNINQKITFNYPNNTILGITNPYIQSYADSAYDGGSIKFGIQSSGNGGNLWIQGSGNLDGGSIYTFGGGGSIDTRQGYIELGGPAASGRIKIYKSASTTGTLYNVWPTQTSGTIMVYNGSIAATSGDSLRYNGQYWFATGVSVSGGSGTSDHSALSNLTVGDPHTQYVYMGVSGSIAVTGHRNIIYASGSNAVGLEVKELNNASSFHCENAAGDDLFDLTNGQIIMKGPLSIGNYTAYLNFESQSTTNHTVRVADGVDGYLVVSDNIPDPAFKEFLVSVSPTGLSTFRTINSGDLPSTLIYASGTPSANNYLRYNGSVWVPSGSAGGGGISSLNGLSDSTQSLAVTTSGTDFTITTSGSTHLFNLPTATSSRRGALSSTDWSTFNGKQNLITGAATSITVADLGGDLAVVSNAFGKISTSLTNATEIGYISGVTSSVQTQLNNKLGTTLASGNIFIGDSNNIASGITLGGDASIIGTGVLTLSTVNSNVGSFTYSNVTADAKGRITAISSAPGPSGVTAGTGIIITTSSPNYVVHVNPLIPMSLNVSGHLSLGLENPSGYLHIPGSATQPAIVFNTGTLVSPTIKNSLEVNASGLYFTDNDNFRGEVHTYEAGIMYPRSFYSNNVNNTGVLPITGYTYTASSGLLTNKILRITAGGNYQNNTGANATLRVGMLFGEIPIYSDATANIATSANIRPWLFDGFIHCSGSTYQNVFGKFELGSVDAASTGIGGLGANSTIFGVIAGSGSVNLNTNNEFKLTFIHSSTTGSLWVRTRFGVSEIV